MDFGWLGYDNVDPSFVTNVPLGWGMLIMRKLCLCGDKMSFGKPLHLPLNLLWTHNYKKWNIYFLKLNKAKYTVFFLKQIFHLWKGASELSILYSNSTTKILSNTQITQSLIAIRKSIKWSNHNTKLSSIVLFYKYLSLISWVQI